MPQMTDDECQQRARGQRAECVAEWYFRLNGFLSIPGFIVHIDSPEAEVRANGIVVGARTEADFIGVRFPHSREIVNEREMQDDERVIKMSGDAQVQKPLFVLVEVKAGVCKMNNPWSNSDGHNMERVIRRLGFAAQEEQVLEVAKAMYSEGRWESLTHILQYICVGKKKNQKLSTVYPSLVQIDWDDIGNFLYKRFVDFPEKLPSGHVHDQWTGFGKSYGKWFVDHRPSNTSDSVEFVKNYVNKGEACAQDSASIRE